MAYTVKQKIRLGTLFLFLLLLLLGGLGIFHITRLKNDSQVILKDNYESLDYCHTMQQAFDKGDLPGFENALSKQETNVTEKGEERATNNTRVFFEKYKNGDHSDSTVKSIRANIQQVLLLNMSAIEAKNTKANMTADQALTYISLVAAVIFLVGLTFTFNFPSILTDPINAITDGIKEISAKNYHHRIHLDRKDEFGQMATAFNNMADRLEYFENSNLNKIIFEKTRAEAVINSLKDASIGIDKNDIILFANQQALQLLGMQASQVVAMPVSEVAGRNDLFRFLVEEKGGLPFKIVVENRENYFIKETLDISQDGTSGKVIVLKNITSFKELDVAKTNFIATISHELKTPLAASDFSLKLLEDTRTGTLNNEQKEYINNLKQDNQRMLKILSELLNMAQVESGKIQLNIRQVSPYGIAENAIDSVSRPAKEKNITITTQFDDNLGDIIADPDKTAWVLNNFLTNAIKYSPVATGIVVKLKNAGDTVEFSVTDKGPGIQAGYLDKIFDRFFKIPGAKGGSGLGLTISKEFIEAQQGRIWVKSEIGDGSTFGFNLRRMPSA